MHSRAYRERSHFPSSIPKEVQGGGLAHRNLDLAKDKLSDVKTRDWWYAAVLSECDAFAISLRLILQTEVDSVAISC